MLSWMGRDMLDSDKMDESGFKKSYISKKQNEQRITHAGG